MKQIQDALHMTRHSVHKEEKHKSKALIEELQKRLQHSTEKLEKYKSKSTHKKRDKSVSSSEGSSQGSSLSSSSSSSSNSSNSSSSDSLDPATMLQMQQRMQAFNQNRNDITHMMQQLQTGQQNQPQDLDQMLAELRNAPAYPSAQTTVPTGFPISLEPGISNYQDPYSNHAFVRRAPTTSRNLYSSQSVRLLFTVKDLHYHQNVPPSTFTALQKQHIATYIDGFYTFLRQQGRAQRALSKTTLLASHFKLEIESDDRDKGTLQHYFAQYMRSHPLRQAFFQRYTLDISSVS